MTMKIDKTDLHIIELLMEDGRMNASEIGRRIGATERSVRYRIERLVNKGVISITAVANPRAVGYNVVADVWVEVDSGLINTVVATLLELDFVPYVATSIGQRDVSVQILGRDNDEVYHIVAEVIGKIPGVRKTTTSIVPNVLRDVYEWHIPPRLVSGNGSAEVPGGT